jgi:hypothetical protein
MTFREYWHIWIGSDNTFPVHIFRIFHNRFADSGEILLHVPFFRSLMSFVSVCFVYSFPRFLLIFNQYCLYLFVYFLCFYRDWMNIVSSYFCIYFLTLSRSWINVMSISLCIHPLFMISGPDYLNTHRILRWTHTKLSKWHLSSFSITKHKQDGVWMPTSQ